MALAVQEATLRSFFAAVAQSRLEVLDLGNLIDRPDELWFTALIRQIPALRKLKELRFTISDGTRFGAPHQMVFLGAMKDNFSLQKVSAGRHMNPQNQQRLNAYLERNKRLAEFSENPESMSRNVRPYALDMAGNAPGTLFLALKTVLLEVGEEVAKERSPTPWNWPEVAEVAPEAGRDAPLDLQHPIFPAVWVAVVAVVLYLLVCLKCFAGDATA